MLTPHLQLRRRDVGDFVLLPGDPRRVDVISKFLKNAELLKYNREFKTITGYYDGIKVSAVSTGIGAPAMAIVVEELASIGAKVLIRVGSCGALQNKMRVGELVIPEGAVREEGTSSLYVDENYPAIPDYGVYSALVAAAKKNKVKFHSGIIRSHDSFYVPYNKEWQKYWSRYGVIASDMETSVLFVLSKLKGIKAGSVLNIVDEFMVDVRRGVDAYAHHEKRRMEGEKREIKTALDAVKIIKNYEEGIE
ncbi:MAG: nucleoside phosphorylase [Candidatus Anstonellales archaeon]